MTTRRLTLFLVANFVLVNGTLLAALGGRTEDTGLPPIAWFLEGRQGGDSWDSIAMAYLQATTPDRVEKPFYWRSFFNPQLRKGFQYPPTALLVASALEAVAGERWLDALRWITWAMVPITALFVWLLYEALRPRPAPDGRDRWWALLGAVVGTLTFYPVMRAYANGQIQSWLNVLFAIAVWCWATGRRGTAGAVLALSCAVKPQLAVFVLWGLIRRQWRFLATFLAVGTALLGTSVALYGWGPHAEYPGLLRFLAERGEAYFPNQSMNGLLNRWVFEDYALLWRRRAWIDHFPPFDARVFAGTMVSSLALLAIGLAPPRSPAARAGLIDFCLMGLAATMASPIAWEHHYGIALPIFVAASLTFGQDARARFALAAAYVVVSNCFWVTKALAASRLNVLESYLFFGAIVLLIVLVRGRGPLAVVGAPAPPAPSA